MAETFKSSKAGDPTVLARFYLRGGGTYRQQWTWEFIDANDVVTAEYEFGKWRSVTQSLGFTLKIGATASSTAIVTSTDITYNTGGNLVVKVSSTDTALLQASAPEPLSDSSEWVGVLRGYDEQGDLKVLGRLKAILQHMPL